MSSDWFESGTFDPDDELSVAYARVSKKEQGEDGCSIDNQKNQTRRMAEERGVKPSRDVICDDGETGTDFDRPGVDELISEVTTKDISYLFITELSRLGRSAPATVYFIDQLQEKFGVTVVTNDGPIDFQDSNDLMGTVVEAVTDQRSVKTTARSAAHTRNMRFRDKKWTSSGFKTPLGYNHTDDDWLVVDEDEAKVVVRAYNHFLRSKCYTDTANHIAGLYGDEDDETVDNSWFECKNKGDELNIDPDRIPSADNGSAIKRMLKRDVYVGNPGMNHKSPLVEEGASDVEDPNLQIVDEELHAKVQEVIKEIEDKNSDNGVPEPDDLAETFGLLEVFGSDPNIKLHCPECDSLMRKNGTPKLDGGFKTQNYQCKNDDCGRQYRFPNQETFDRIMWLRDRFEEEEEKDEDE